MIKSIGNRAHDFGKLEPSKLAVAIAHKELESIQLALNKAITGIDDLSKPIAHHELYQIASAMVDKDIRISVLGCYLNYAHPDKEQREKNIAIFRQHLHYAKIFGAWVVGTETGSILQDYSYHPDNHTDRAYRLFKDSLVKMAVLAEEVGVYIALEGVATHKFYLRLI